MKKLPILLTLIACFGFIACDNAPSNKENALELKQRADDERNEKNALKIVTDTLGEQNVINPTTTINSWDWVLVKFTTPIGTSHSLVIDPVGGNLITIAALDELWQLKIKLGAYDTVEKQYGTELEGADYINVQIEDNGYLTVSWMKTIPYEDTHYSSLFSAMVLPGKNTVLNPEEIEERQKKFVAVQSVVDHFEDKLQMKGAPFPYRDKGKLVVGFETEKEDYNVIVSDQGKILKIEHFALR